MKDPSVKGLQGIIVHIEYLSVCPFVGIGFPPPPPFPPNEYVSPLGPNERGGNTPLRVRGGGTQFGGLERRPGTLNTLWIQVSGVEPNQKMKDMEVRKLN
jgi:hypothetical protein